MAVIATVIEFVRSLVEGIPVTDVKFDEGGEDNATGELYQPAGFDAPPIAGDTVLAVRQPGEARWAVIGYIDPANQLTAAAGEVRLFSRDSDGNIVGEFVLRNSGEIHAGVYNATDATGLASKINALWEAFTTTTPVVNDGGKALQDAVKLIFSAMSGDVSSERLKVDK